MKLEGSLDAFSLPDIFQLLSYTKKTGGLLLQHGGSAGVVHFVDGAVTGASTERGRLDLARRLVGGGHVTAAQLEAAVEAAASGRTTVVQALLADGAVPLDVVQHVAADQVDDAVAELLRWSDGEFSFQADELNLDDVGLRQATDELVALAEERRSAWEAAAEVVPSPDGVPVLVGSDVDAVVRPEEWPVLRLLDGSRSVADVVTLSGGGQLGVVSVLAELVERGLVVLEPAGATARVSAADLIDLIAGLEDRLAGAERPTATEPVRRSARPSAASTRPVATAARPAGASPKPAPRRSAPTVVTLPDQPGAAPTTPPAPKRPAAVAETPDVDRTPQPAAATSGDDAAISAPTTEPAEPPAVADPAERVRTKPERLGGAHVPGDVVPPRPEPFRAPRRPEFAETAPGLPGSGAARRSVGPASSGTAATALATEHLVERDPSVNRSLLLRLIAGVRGL